MPKFSCPHCEQHIDADEGLAGESVECPSCQAIIVVPVELKLTKPLQGSRLPAVPASLKATGANPAVPRRVLSPVAPVDAPGAGTSVSPGPKAAPTAPSAPREPSFGWDMLTGSAVALGLASAFTVLNLPSLRTGAPAAVRSVQEVLGETGIAFVAAAVAALVVGLIAGVFGRFLKKPFGSSFVRTFTVVVILGGMLSPASVYFARTQGVVARMMGQSASSPSPSASPVLDPPPPPALAPETPVVPSVPVPASAPDPQAAQATVRGLEADLKALTTALLDSKGAPKTTDLHFEKPTTPSNDFDRIREFMQSFFNDQVALQNGYLAALEKAGIAKVLEPARLASDAEFRETHVMLGDLRKVVAEFCGKSEAHMKSFPQRIESSSFSPEVKQSMLAGYNEGLGRSVPLFEETWQLEAASLDHVAEIVQFLDGSRSAWSVQDGQVAFQRNEDLEKFKVIMAKLQDGTRRQTELREKTLQSASGTLGDLKLLLPK